MKHKRMVLICVFYLFGCSLLFPQGNTAQPTPTPTTTPSVSRKNAAGKIALEPVEYTNKEFPGWVHDVRRAEIIFIGSIPLTFFLVTEIFDTYRFMNNGLTTDTWDTRYAPWPLGSTDKIAYDDEEKAGILLSALAVSLITAGADYIIGRIKNRDLCSR